MGSCSLFPLFLSSLHLQLLAEPHPLTPSPVVRSALVRVRSVPRADCLFLELQLWKPLLPTQNGRNAKCLSLCWLRSGFPDFWGHLCPTQSQLWI